jgi:hypothetical protein
MSEGRSEPRRYGEETRRMIAEWDFFHVTRNAHGGWSIFAYRYDNENASAEVRYGGIFFALVREGSLVRDPEFNDEPAPFGMYDHVARAAREKRLRLRGAPWRCGITERILALVASEPGLSGIEIADRLAPTLPPAKTPARTRIMSMLVHLRRGMRMGRLKQDADCRWHLDGASIPAMRPSPALLPPRTTPAE